jgi:hypothetical protein
MLRRTRLRQVATEFLKEYEIEIEGKEADRE